MSPLKRVLLRTMPELEPELRDVVNAFDPWARDRGEYYIAGVEAAQGRRERRGVCEEMNESAR